MFFVLFSYVSNLFRSDEYFKSFFQIYAGMTHSFLFLPFLKHKNVPVPGHTDGRHRIAKKRCDVLYSCTKLLLLVEGVL